MLFFVLLKYEFINPFIVANVVFIFVLVAVYYIVLDELDFK